MEKKKPILETTSGSKTVAEPEKSYSKRTRYNEIDEIKEKLRFVSPCFIVQFKQITNLMQQFFSLLS
jgi:hypothetical protein